MLKNDKWIIEMASQGMVSPFEDRQICKVDNIPTISYGLSSFGYDIRLSPKEFRIFRHIPGTVLNPKNFNPDNLELTALQQDEEGSYFILPAHSYGLGVSLEKLDIPNNVIVICVGKSTYARCGIIANVTPAEAAWRGYLTLEFSNSSSADCRIYANEGIIQLIFLEGEPCSVSYEDRKGKYQEQPDQVIFSRV